MKKTFTFGIFFNMLRFKVSRGTRAFNASSGEISAYLNPLPEYEFIRFDIIWEVLLLKETVDLSLKNQQESKNRIYFTYRPQYQFEVNTGLI